MGCKPSKKSQVATGNTVHTTPILQKKKSNAFKNLKTEEISSTITPLPTDKANDATTTNDANVKTVEDEDGNKEKVEEEVREEKEFERERVEEIRNVRVMDVQQNNNMEEESEERWNVIAPDSPDLFFSTRKEEVPLEILTVPLVEKSEADHMPENDVSVGRFKVDHQQMKEEKEANDVKDMNVKDNDDIEERKEEIKEEKGLGRETVEEIKNVNVKNAQENNNNKEETKEKRNVIAPDSPDQFFSTRKDEVPVEILTLPLAETLEAGDVPENNVLLKRLK